MATVNVGGAKKYLDLEGLKKYDGKIRELLETKVSSIDAATADKLGLVKIGDGIAVDAGKISVKPKTNGAISVTEDGVDVDFSKGTKASSSTLGLVTVGDGIEATDGKIAVEAKDDGGLTVDGDGVSVNAKTNGGLTVDEDGVSVNVAASGGVAVGANGLSVDWTAAPKAGSNQLGMVKPGNGVTVAADGTLSVNADSIPDDSISLDKIEGGDDLVKKTDISGVYKYMGSVANYEALQAVQTSGLEAGSVYDVQDTDMNYAWNGTKWDPLGSTFSITSISDSEIDSLFAAE